VRLAVLITVAAALLLLPLETRGAMHQVDIVDFAFSPATITVNVGDSVTWTNSDAVVHTATSTSGAFDSGDLDQDESYTLTFSQAGTYEYLCTPHPEMTGRVIVQQVSIIAGGIVPDVAMAQPGFGDTDALRTLLAIVTVLLVLATALLVVIRARHSASR
jgi:amicyanin